MSLRFATLVARALAATASIGCKKLSVTAKPGSITGAKPAMDVVTLPKARVSCEMTVETWLTHFLTTAKP